MSNSGFRGRGFGQRGARSNGPANGFSGPRFPHPSFNHPRPPHRLSASEKWTERPNFMQWQQKNFLPHPQYRGNLQFRPNGRGRAAGGRGIVRFSGPGRPPAPQFCGGFVRNPAPRPQLVPEEQIEDKSTIVSHAPLLGSEEERQQKITETADKLKQKLSSITEEELTNFWEDDFSVLPNSISKDETTQNKGIPELRHEPPELDLTFTDFKDIGRVDCNNSKLDDSNDDISITFEETPTNKFVNVNHEIIVIDEHKEESLNAINSMQDTVVLDRSNTLENNEYHEQVLRDLPDSGCNPENLNPQCNNIAEELIFSDSNNTEEKSSTSNLQENLTNVTPVELINDLAIEKPSDLGNVETTLNDQGVLRQDISENQNLVQTNTDTSIHQTDNVETNLFKHDQILNEARSDTSQEETCQGCDSKSSVCPGYGEPNKLTDDKKSNNPPAFQSRVYNIPTRFSPRIQGPRCRWPYQQNGQNLFPHGPQRLPFHGNRMIPPRHIPPYKPNDLVPIVFDRRAPPPYASNVPVSGHDSQHNNVMMPFPPAFDPSEPPPNIRPKIDSSNGQPPHPFDPRGPPPRLTSVTNENLLEFNPQQPPPKVHKRDETLQPPPIFDPRLSSRERSSLITPLDSARPNLMTVNIIETSPVSDFNFPQIPPMNMTPRQPYIGNVQTNFQPILPQTGNGQMMMREYSLPLPPMNIANVPLPLPKESSSLEETSNSGQGISMDDGLEDMQEAMEFAKQIMNMTEETENEKVPLTPSEIPIPNEDASRSSAVDEARANVFKKQKKKESRSKKSKQITAACGPVSNNERQEVVEAVGEEENVDNRGKIIDEALLTHDQIRPKVVFNLNSKTKKIHKSEEWHRIPASTYESKETCQQQGTPHNRKEKTKSKRHYPGNKRNNTNQNRNNVKANSTRCTQDTNSSVQNENHGKDSEKSHPRSTSTTLPNNTSTQRNPKSRKESRKVKAPTSESTWKSRVINRFLKMSKNDICNMVNNSSLRKFDIAMKHLVKEKRPSLSLEMRTTEDEKMKEYDREEFMNQLNAMLDPGAVVGITDLPTEFIHHLSEVLQLDPMPFELELSEARSTDVEQTPNANVSRRSVSESSNKETKARSCTESSSHQNACTKVPEDNSVYNEVEFSDFSLSQENLSSLKRIPSLNQFNPEIENTCKKQQQQPLFNEADLDDILSEVTDRSKQITKENAMPEPEKPSETCQSSLLMRTVTDSLKCNAFVQIPSRTVVDLDDIFSAGIARVRSTDPDSSRTRKSNSEDRGTFGSGRYERWSRKERDDPDTFRNLTKEEWEAKYGSKNIVAGLTVARKCASNSAENLWIEETRSKENRNHHADRYWSSDSPMRRLSLSPSTVHRSSMRLEELDNLHRFEESESGAGSSSNSSSDSDETVAPDVSKLLKVIKEKEKIAKKKSLNETIRDEVTAEIEKKWKEKNKYKERKSRKREKRKRDRKEKRKKEKKKRRNKNSHSESSKSSEEFRLLTENEIKKEVIVKEEPASALQENVPFNDEINQSSVVPASVNKPNDLVSRIEPPQNSQVEKQQVPRVTCDASPQIRNKPTVVSITVQPKTKAQLKQMPEYGDGQEKRIIEKTVAFTKDNVANVDGKKTKGQMEMNKHEETIENNNERASTVSPVNNSFHRVNVSVNVTEPSSCVQPEVKTTNNNNSTNKTLLGTEPVTEVGSSNRSAEQKIVSTVASTAESKSGYKKIDIKAYKERALQRRLKEQAMTKENSGNSVSFSKNLYHITPIDISTAVESVKSVEMDAGGEPSKDPRLAKTRSTSTPEVKEKTDSEEKCQNVDISHKSKESSISVQSKVAGEPGINVTKRSTSQPIDSEANTLNDSVKIHKNDSKSLSKDAVMVNKKLKTLPTTAELNKFKNIRSEGSKELKLKKEKMKKSMEKKKQLSTVEKCIDNTNVTEGIQEPPLMNTDNTNSTKIEEVDDSETSESQITHCETVSNEAVSNKHDRSSVTNDEEVLDQPIADQGTAEIESSESSLNLRNKGNSIKKMDETIIKTVTTAESEVTPFKEASSKSVVDEECATDAIPSPDIVTKESHSSGEQIDSEIMKDTGKSESLTIVPTQDNATSGSQGVEDINKNDDASPTAKTNGLKDQADDESVLQDVQTPSNHDKTDKAESLDTPNGPFNSFVAASTNGDKEDVKEYPEQLLEPCLNEKSDSTNNDDESFRKETEGSETLSVCNLTEKAQSFIENDTAGRVIHDHSNVADNIEIGTKMLETEDSNIMQEQSETSDTIIKQKDTSSTMNMNSQSTFNDNSEPFIVLDEYINDEKSMEKLGARDLDLEDCIARDADIFTSKHSGGDKCSMNNIKLPNFNSIDFKDLSEVFDKNDMQENQDGATSLDGKEKSLFDKGKEFVHKEREMNSTNVVSSVSGKNIELSIETSQSSKSADSVVPAIPAKSVQIIESVTLYVDKTPLHDSARSKTPKLSKTVENVHTINALEDNSEHNSDRFNATRSVIASVESETSPKLNILAKSAIRKSLENLSTVGMALGNNEPKNKPESNNSFVDKLISTTPSETKASNDKDTSLDSTAKEATPRTSNKRSSSKSNQKEKDETLHKVKDKSKMKREKRKKHDISGKMIKEAVKSDVVEVKHPNTKEDILARMIEIDVEIHKLMTEKMTLYQMLTNDTLPTENNLQQNNVVHVTKETDTPILRPRTPGLLMSQLIQNLETTPATNQCTKKSTDTKDNMVNSVQSTISKTPHKQEHHADKKENCTPAYDSDEEKMTNSAGNRPSTSKKRKKHKSERTAKRFENKSDGNVSVGDSQGTITEKKQTNEMKLTSKRTEHDSSQISINEMKSQEGFNKTSTQQINKEDLSNNDKLETVDKMNKKTTVSIESKTFTDDVQPKNKENCLVKDNKNIIETSVKKDTRLNPAVQLSENRTLERSLIYSDDSTWDTVLQNPNAQNQKKLNTGLALLEETYRKEIAKTRRTRVESRKKKKRKMQNIPEIVKSLTPEEEELPLSALCAKKLSKRKKLLGSQDQEQTNTDPQVWKNVVEVINAVAENRMEQLYVERSERQSSGETRDIVPDVADVEKDSDSKLLEEREKETVVSSASKNTQETYSESSVNSKTVCKSTDNTDNDLNEENLHLTSSSDKPQAYLHHDEQIQQNLDIGVTSKGASSLSETSVCDNTSWSFHKNMTESCTQETVENDSAEVSRLPLIENSDTGAIRSDTNDVVDVPNRDPHEEKVDEVKESSLQEKDINGKKRIVTEEDSSSPEMVTMSQSSERNENSSESVNEVPCVSKEDCNFLVNQNNDSLIDQKKDTANDTSTELNYTSQDESFISLKEQRGIEKRKASNEENNNKNYNTDTLMTEETSSKKSKRKRGNKNPIRRSSRYTEETTTKRVKLETDVNPQDIDQELQNKTEQITLPSVSNTLLAEKDVKSTSTHVSAKKSKSHKSQLNRRRHKAGPPTIETLPNQPISNDEPAKEMKKHKQYTLEMKNCEVKLVDCKHTILNRNVSSDVLQKYGISAVNLYTYLNSTETDSVMSAIQTTSTKDSSSLRTKRKSSTSECPESQPTEQKLNRLEDTIQSSSSQIIFANVENNQEERIGSDIDAMPDLIKEPVVVDVLQNCEKPDVEIVEEKKATAANQQYNNSESTSTVIDTKVDKELPRTQYTVHKGPILDIKVFGNSFLAASEDGRIYRYNKTSNGILNIYKGHTAAVTCLYVYNTSSVDINKEWMFSGSLDGTLRCYDITSGAQIRDTADIGSPIQCMDEAWGIIFIGTKSGHVSRYHMKSGVIKGTSIQFSDKSVLALKATNEGPRKVLIVASRSQPITIRDAQNGLFLRTICGQKSYTVYSLMRDNNLIYCGTSSTSIPVFDFTNGEQILQYEAGVGIVCMRLYKKLLFAGCYDGNIYVFNTKDHQLVCSIPGPGNMLLSMEVVDNKIIAGSKDKRLQSWQMPLQVRALL